MSAYVFRVTYLKVLFFGIVLKSVLVYATDINEPLQLRENYKNPVLDHPYNRYIVSSGNTWKLKCTGSAPLSWTFPNCSSIKSNNTRITITPEESDSHYASYLEISELEYYDTGYYLCYYQELYSECDYKLHNQDDVAATYLYSSDPENLLTLYDRTIGWPQYNLHEGWSVDINCKPTDPSVKMEFFLNFRDITQSLESFNFQYDDKRGLISVSGQPNQNGILVCKASRDGVKQDIQIQLNYRTRLLEYNGYIETTGPCQKELLTGENIVLTCSFEVDRKAPHIVLEWEQEPSNYVSSEKVVLKNSDHFAIGETDLSNIGYDRSIYTSMLTIQDLSKDDIGKYECYAIVSETGERSLPGSYILEDSREDENEMFISEFKSHAPIPLPDINNCVEVCTEECSKHHKCHLTWILYKSENRSVFAAPNPQYTWYKPNGERIDVNINENNQRSTYGHYIMEILGDCKESMKLVKEYPELKDMGEYILNIGVSNPITSDEKSKNISLVMVYNKTPEPKLKIKELDKSKHKNKKKKKSRMKPRLKTTPIVLFHRANTKHKLTCAIEGYPINTDDVQMIFTPCTDPVNDVCTDTPRTIKLDPWISTDGLVNDQYSYRKKASHETTLNESGILTCNICSSEEPNCSKKQISSTKIYLSDFNEGFEVQGPKKDTAIELETITLLCAASKYLYKKVSWYQQNRDTLEWESIDEILQQSSDNIDINNRPNSKFSCISTITFSRIQMHQGGSYQCKATPKNDDEDPTIETLHLTVLKSSPPERTSTFNMNETNKCTERYCTEGLDTLNLDCSVTGRPEPVVKWRFKANNEQDFQEFPPQNSSFFEQVEFLENGQKLQFHALWKEQSGVYQCIAKSVAGEVVGERRISIRKHSPITKGLIAGVVIGVFVLIALIIFLSYKLCWYNKQLRKLTDIEMKMFEEGDIGKINPTLGVDDQADLLPYNKEFEFDRKKLELGDQIGSGAFGRVVKATADGIVTKNEKTQVAVKMVKRDADITYIKALMAELKIMIHLGKVNQNKH